MAGWAGLAGWARPVSDKLGPSAGVTGLASRRVAGWAGPEPSLRHVRQAWPAGGHAFQDKKAFFRRVSTFSTKMDPWSWTPTNPENFQARRTGFLGQPTWVGGGGGVGGGEKRRLSLEKRSERPWPLWGRGEFYQEVSF